jgi:hypothetical protein
MEAALTISSVLDAPAAEKVSRVLQATRRDTAMPMSMKDTHDNLMPGAHVKVLTKHQVDGQPLCGTIIGAAPNTPDTYIVEYHPGLDNGHHSGNELKVIDEELPCNRA